MPSPTADRPLNLSQLLANIIDGHASETITLFELAAALRGRAWGGLLLIFASINLLPLPPGSTVLTGIPLMVVTAQMMLGRDSPWFPKQLHGRAFTKAELRAWLAKLLPWERRVERYIRPRLWRLTNHRGMRAIGCISLMLSVILWLPIPFGNHAPALSMTLFAIALLYRDGIVAVLGYAATLGSILIVLALAAGVFFGATYAIQNYLPTLAGLRG